MANRERGEVAMDVDGKTYTLRPTFDACCELETLTDRAFEDFLTDASKGRMTAIRGLVWCYLHEHHGAEIRTLKDASAWIERAGGIAAISAALQQVHGVNQPDGEPGDGGENPPDAQGGTGASASSLPVVTASLPTTSGRTRRVSSIAS